MEILIGALSILGIYLVYRLHRMLRPRHGDFANGRKKTVWRYSRKSKTWLPAEEWIMENRVKHSGKQTT